MTIVWYTDPSTDIHQAPRRASDHPELTKAAQQYDVYLAFYLPQYELICWVSTRFDMTLP